MLAGQVALAMGRHLAPAKRSFGLGTGGGTAAIGVIMLATQPRQSG